MAQQTEKKALPTAVDARRFSPATLVCRQSELVEVIRELDTLGAPAAIIRSCLDGVVTKWWVRQVLRSIAADVGPGLGQRMNSKYQQSVNWLVYNEQRRADIAILGQTYIQARQRIAGIQRTGRGDDEDRIGRAAERGRIFIEGYRDYLTALGVSAEDATIPFTRFWGFVRFVESGVLVYMKCQAQQCGVYYVAQSGAGPQSRCPLCWAAARQYCGNCGGWVSEDTSGHGVRLCPNCR